MRDMVGKFYGIGVGPGNPELITLKAAKILGSADVICAPKSSEDKKSIALAIAKTHVKKNAKIIQPVFRMSRNIKELEKSWEEATEMIFSELKEGRDVAFITIGDPLFYSTYSYILKKMKERHSEVEVETIPGITSLSACFAQLNLPLAERNEKIAVLPAAYGLKELKKLANFDAVVLMKVSRSFDRIVETLKKLGLKESATFVSRCGSGDFFSSDLDSMLGREIDYLSMIIIKRKK